MTTKIKITLTLDTDPTQTPIKDVGNAVRRAVSALGDTNLSLTVPTISKGISFDVRAVKPAKPYVSATTPIRQWAAENGYPEVANKRGRIKSEILAAYEAAN